MKKGKTYYIAGTTGSGKTQFVKCFISQLHPNTFVIITETDEYNKIFPSARIIDLEKYANADMENKMIIKRSPSYEENDIIEKINGKIDDFDLIVIDPIDPFASKKDKLLEIAKNANKKGKIAIFTAQTVSGFRDLHDECATKVYFSLPREELEELGLSEDEKLVILGSAPGDHVIKS